MSREVIHAKLDSLARCLMRIESKKPFTVEQLVSDFDLQDIVTVNLERAVQASVDIASIVLSEKLEGTAPSTMSESFLVLANQKLIDASVAERIVKALGFRNIAVHEYEKMDWTIVHRIAHQHLDDFRAFARQIEVSS